MAALSQCSESRTLSDKRKAIARDLKHQTQCDEYLNSQHSRLNEPIDNKWFNYELVTHYKKRLSNAIIEQLYAILYWNDRWSGIINHELLDMKQRCMFYELSKQSLEEKVATMKDPAFKEKLLSEDLHN